MGRSLVLAAYLAWSARAAAFGERTLTRRLAQGKEDPARLPERRGEAAMPRPEGPLMWVHCASVGEAVSVLEVIRGILDERPDLHVMLTTGTVTSAGLIAPQLPDRAFHQFIPVDAGPFVKRFLDHWQPTLAVWTESELWPTLLHQIHARGVPLVLINARMSEESFRKWHWVRGAAKSLLGRFTLLRVQDRDTARRLRRLGAPTDRIEITGTLKEGAAPPPCSEATRARFAAQLEGRPCWLAASTHPGEEAQVAIAHKIAGRSSHRLLMILAPRHPERGDEITETLRADGWTVAQRSKDDPVKGETQIYVADTLGEMGLWFRICPVTFLGGSLARVGGHNPFEPAGLGSAILTGPHTHNFKDIFSRLADADAMRLVHDGADLGAQLDQVLAPDEAARMAHAAWEVCSDGAEVVDDTIRTLGNLLDEAEG